MNLAYFQRNVRLLIEGIQIKDFSKLNNDPEFIEACKLYASMIKNDNEAKQKFNLYNLDIYKQNLQGFIEQVQQAYQYINGQRQFNKLLKKPLPKGVNLVYKDKKCLIVSPETYMNSHDAAYLDGASATWCVASPGSSAEQYWDMYEAIIIFYIYFPDMSYVMVTSYGDFKKIINKKSFVFTFGDVKDQKGSQIEDRRNNSYENPEKQQELLGQLKNRLPNINEILTQYILQNQNNNSIIDRLKPLEKINKLAELENKLFETADIQYLKEYIKVADDKNKVKEKLYFWIYDLYHIFLENKFYSSTEDINKFKNILLYCLNNFKNIINNNYYLLNHSLYNLCHEKKYNLRNLIRFIIFLIDNIYLENLNNSHLQREIVEVITSYIITMTSEKDIVNKEIYDNIIEYIFLETYKKFNFKKIILEYDPENITKYIFCISKLPNNRIKKYFIDNIFYDIAINANKIVYSCLMKKCKNMFNIQEVDGYIWSEIQSDKENYVKMFKALIELFKFDDYLNAKLKMDLANFKHIDAKDFFGDDFFDDDDELE